MIVELTKEEVHYCTTVAIHRWLMKFDSVDRPNYAEGKANGVLEHEVLANIRANVSEWAVAKHYNLSWNFPVYPNEYHGMRKNLPDVGVDGEVRTIRTKNAIPFWSKDSGKYIYGTKVVNNDKFNKVEVFNKFLANDFMKKEYEDSSINGWRVPTAIL